MRDLPAEILFKVFDHLSRANKLQCATVCKSWCTAALSLLNSKIHLRNSNDTIILFEKLCQIDGSFRGSSIHHLSLSNNSRISDAQINRVVFIRILSECTNLKTLEFTDISFDVAYLEHMVRYRNSLHLNSLQCIKTQYSSSSSYLLANWHYHQHINQLRLLTTASSFNTFQYANDLSSYLNHFAALKNLSLKFHCTIYIHSLLSACPQLESLELTSISSSSRLEIHDNKAAIQQSSTPFQLKYFNMGARYINQDLFEYLHDRAGHLFQLTVCQSGFEDLTQIDNAFNTALVVDTVLPIKRIIFKNNVDVSRSIILGLNDNFRALKVIDFQSCGFNRIVDQNCNLTLDFGELDLDYLSIDFTTILSFNNQVNTMSLAIQTHALEDTVYYHRTSKWSAAHLFTRNETKRYTSATAQRNRIYSNKISVITIEAYALRCIRMYGEGNHKSFSQIIPLD